MLPHCEDKQLIVVFNKSDLIKKEQQEELAAQIKTLLPDNKESIIFISAKEHQQTDELETLLIKSAHLPKVTQNDVILNSCSMGCTDHATSAPSEQMPLIAKEDAHMRFARAS